eukprot:Opistho-2@92289
MRLGRLMAVGLMFITLSLMLYALLEQQESTFGGNELLRGSSKLGDVEDRWVGMIASVYVCLYAHVFVRVCVRVCVCLWCVCVCVCVRVLSVCVCFVYVRMYVRVYVCL